MSWLFEQVQSVATSVAFLSIFVGGVLFSVVSMIFGADHDGDVDSGDMDGDHGDASDHDDGPKLLSIRGASLFLTAFGGVGYIVYSNTEKPFFALVAGIVGGVLFTLPMLSFIGYFMRQESSSLIKPEQYIGVEGVVTTSIHPNQIGEVRISVSGSQMSLSAISDKEIKTGSQIRVDRYVGGSVHVSKI